MKNLLKGGVKSVFSMLGIELSRKRKIDQPKPPKFGNPLNAYEALIREISKNKETLEFVIIGANDGANNDPGYPIIKNYISKKSNVMLFEPNTWLIPKIEESYSFHPSKHICNEAIGGGDKLHLYVVKEEFWPALQPNYAAGWPIYRAPLGITSGDPDRVKEWVRRVGKGAVDPDVAVMEIEVAFTELLPARQKRGLEPEIDVLQIDAEGFDDEVIAHSNIEATRPKLIRFESAFLTPERVGHVRDLLGDRYAIYDVGEDALCLRIGA